MAPCCDTPSTRIEKVHKKQLEAMPVLNPDASPYDELPAPYNGNPMAPTLPSDGMMNLVQMDIDRTKQPINPSGPSDPLESEVGNVGGVGPVGEVEGEIPTFLVPENPLLPPGYREILDYDSLQYAMGFYRTQIGRYVRVQQLIGSSTITEVEGYLIAVSVNYLILQEMSTSNITVIDAYSIKSMYIYYNLAVSPPQPCPTAPPPTPEGTIGSPAPVGGIGATGSTGPLSPVGTGSVSPVATANIVTAIPEDEGADI